jgi:hypothetical protein
LARRRGLACCVLLSGILLSLPCRATTVLPTTLSQMCAQADMIFVGAVSEVRSQWADADALRIETFVTFADLQILLGAPAPTITLSFAGGRMGDVVEAVAEMPAFAVGERVLLFAHEGRYVSPIVGFHQGCFRVVESDGEPVVLNANGLPVRSFEQGRAVVSRDGSESKGALRLSTLVERIRNELSGRHWEGVRR